MVQGIYTAESGMIPRMNQQKNVSNNLANQTTHGYKKGLIFLRQLITAQDALDHAKGIERTKITEDFRIDYSQGTLDKTDNNYDIALNGSGFFRVQDKSGNIYYTRDGRFFTDPDGKLVTSTGMNLLNDRNSVISILGRDVKITGNGDIIEDGTNIGTIGLADFEKKDYPSLKSIGGGLYIKPANVNEVKANPDTQYLQGYLEESNVDPVLTMVDMIELFRMYEMGQKSIQIQDQTLNRVITEIGVIK